MWSVTETAPFGALFGCLPKDQFALFCISSELIVSSEMNGFPTTVTTKTHRTGTTPSNRFSHNGRRRRRCRRPSKRKQVVCSGDGDAFTASVRAVKPYLRYDTIFELNVKSEA